MNDEIEKFAKDVANVLIEEIGAACHASGWKKESERIFNHG